MGDWGLERLTVLCDDDLPRHYPAYILNWGNLRSLAHVVATASVLNVALRLAKRPLM